MLRDRERETLDEIQHRLVTDDPQFTASFDISVHRLAAHRPAAHQTAITAMVAVLLTVPMIVVHAAGPAMFFTAVACLLIRLRWGNLTRDRHQSP